MERDSMVFYKSFFEAIKDLPPEEFKKCAVALMEYGLEGKEPETAGIEKTVYIMAKPQIDKNNQRYENGKKGGKTVTESEPKHNQSVTKPEPNDNQTGTKQEPNCENAEPNVNDNVNVNVNDNVNENANENENAKDFISCQLIVDMYNDTCVSFPRCTKISDARAKAIKARLKKYTVDDFQKVFELCEQSDFLKGSNNKNWSATFDWIIKDSNMAKVLDGNYNRLRGQPKESGNPFMDLYNEMVEEEKNGFEGDYGGFGGY